MYLTSTFFYSVIYVIWCVGVLVGTILGAIIAKRDDQVEKERYYGDKIALLQQNSDLVGEIKMARLAGIRDARAVLKKSQNLNDADKKLVEIERRV